MGLEYNRILIVDDNRINRLLLLRALKKSAFLKNADFIEAEDGEDALSLLNKYNNEFDLILLDIDMPKIDGVQFLEKRFLDPYISRIPVIVVTTDDSRKKEVLALGIKNEDFIVKPYTVNSFIEKIENMFS